MHAHGDQKPKNIPWIAQKEEKKQPIIQFARLKQLVSYQISHGLIDRIIILIINNNCN